MAAQPGCPGAAECFRGGDAEVGQDTWQHFGQALIDFKLGCHSMRSAPTIARNQRGSDAHLLEAIDTCPRFWLHPVAEGDQAQHGLSTFRCQPGDGPPFGLEAHCGVGKMVHFETALMHQSGITKNIGHLEKPRLAHP